MSSLKSRIEGSSSNFNHLIYIPRQARSMMLPPPCLTVATVSLGLKTLTLTPCFLSTIVAKRLSVCLLWSLNLFPECIWLVQVGQSCSFLDRWKFSWLVSFLVLLAPGFFSNFPTIFTIMWGWLKTTDLSRLTTKLKIALSAVQHGGDSIMLWACLGKTINILT